jgi:SGNH domain (fused to AT3 domains)
MVVVASVIVAAAIVRQARSAPKPVVIATRQQAGPPLRVLLVGDSMAGTLGVGLARAAGPLGVSLINAAVGGCSVAVGWDGGWEFSVMGPTPPPSPCHNQAQLTGYWTTLVDRYRPDAVIYVSRMDTVDQEQTAGSSSRMISILDPQFRAYLSGALEQAVGVLSETGAHVIVTTSAPTKLERTGNSDDDPRRWSAYSAVLDAIAAQSHGTVSLFDLGRFFGGDGPAPAFTLDSPSGVRWRCLDGIHFDVGGGMAVAPSLFAFARQVSPAGALTGTRSAVPASVENQPWTSYAAVKAAIGCAT